MSWNRLLTAAGIGQNQEFRSGWKMHSVSRLEVQWATVANDPNKRVEEEHAEPNAVNGSIYQSAKAMEVVACGDCRSGTLESAAEAGRTVRPCQRGWPRMAGSGRHPCADASPG